MASTNDILREAWSPIFLADLNEQLVFGSVANRTYEGDASQAAAVRISTIGSITVSDYTGVTSTEALNTSSLDLTINQKKYFSFNVDDIDVAQTNLGLAEKAMERASFSTAKAVDAFMMSASAYYGVSGSGTGLRATPVQPTGSTAAYNLIVDVGVGMDEKNVPEDSRFCIVPPWFVGYVLKDSRIITQNPTIQTNGLVSGVTVNGMKVYKSNQLKHNANLWSIVAGTSEALAFAGGLRKMESIRAATSFADTIRGLYVFGGKTVLNNGIYVSWISQT